MERGRRWAACWEVRGRAWGVWVERGQEREVLGWRGPGPGERLATQAGAQQKLGGGGSTWPGTCVRVGQIRGRGGPGVGVHLRSTGGSETSGQDM